MKCKCGFKFSNPGEFRNCEAFITDKGESGIICPKCNTAYVHWQEVELFPRLEPLKQNFTDDDFLDKESPKCDCGFVPLTHLKKIFKANKCPNCGKVLAKKEDSLMSERKKRGYFGIGVENLKSKVNLGTLWRSAYCLGADFIFVIGNRWGKQSSDTIKAYRHIPLYQYENTEHFLKSRPYDCLMVGIEITEKARSIYTFIHPERVIYVLGAEDSSLTFLDKCQSIIQIPSKFCLNVATAGAIIMYDRNQKREIK